MKLCSQCRFFQLSLVATQCRAPGNTEPDYVNGGVRIIYQTAQPVRATSTMCGPEARWFEERAPEQAAA